MDFVRLLPAPPAADSLETRAELDLLLALQAKRTPEQVRCSQSEAKVTMSAFQDVLGASFTPENLPALAGLWKKVDKEMHRITGAAKAHFARQRPAVVESRLEPCGGKETSPAYPSGHAAYGMVYAIILAELAPEQRSALLERGREIGWNRVIAGVHYPSDVAAGRVLGQAVARPCWPIWRFNGNSPKSRRTSRRSEAGEHNPQRASPPTDFAVKFIPLDSRKPNETSAISNAQLTHL